MSLMNIESRRRRGPRSTGLGDHLPPELPSPPITRNQVELMGQDNIPEPDAPGFEALQISPQAIENILLQMLQTAREKAEA
jgi:hypothetical protein